MRHINAYNKFNTRNVCIAHITIYVYYMCNISFTHIVCMIYTMCEVCSVFIKYIE